MAKVHELVHDAPQLPPRNSEEDQWGREERAFFRQLPVLLETLRGKWVAMHNEQVIESGDSLRAVLLKVRERLPQAEVYVQRVDEDLPVFRMSSPRLHVNA